MLLPKQIDQLCDSFENKWLSNNDLLIEDFLASGSFPENEGLINELIIQEVDLRFSAGLTVLQPHYLKRFPDHEPAIQLAFERIAISANSKSLRCQLLTVHSSCGRHDSALGSTEEAQIPAQLQEFSVQNRLGQGAFGVVYRAINQQTSETVALKFPRNRTFQTLGEYERFCNEAELAGRLNHPAIVKTIEIREIDRLPFIVQQYIAGGVTLKHSMDRFSEAEAAVKLTITLARAIGYAHGFGLIHRDLKPSNVLIDEHGNPLVADFGLSVHESFQRRLRGQRCGTPAYMSPEQVMGLTHQLDGRSDIWSLGVILYELLTKGRPFSGSTMDELFEEINFRNEKPLRMLRPDLDRELQRICLKCLSKPIRDRYHTADELADDLENWIRYRDQWRSRSYTPLVPRGLRPFGSDDSEAFIELLPGTRNNLGLPEAIQFWKSKLETPNNLQNFSIGVIFGPSGSGKSSFIRAGLIPRLDPKLVQAVYIEATAHDTEVRLLKGLRSNFSCIPEDVSLPDVLDGIRNGIWSNEQVNTVIILDQFEQWIHRNPQFELSQLTQAFRHCDGTRLSCILLIRDEFWLGTSRLLEYLGIDLRERENVQRIDRFEREHASKVLYLIGRAYGKLPETRSLLTAQQLSFLNQVVKELAEEDRVACVHLTLFAEMFKSREWNLKELRKLGGLAAVGTKFLEETFDSKESPAKYKDLKFETQVILEHLLPTSGGNLRGSMQPRSYLMAAFGSAAKPSRVNLALKYLSEDLRLITQADPDHTSIDNQSDTNSDNLNFQLTHDYLVPSIRNWVEKTKKQTWQGRAELKLINLAIQWKLGNESRFLPSFFDYVRIKLAIPSYRYSDLHSQFMKSATWLHARHLSVIFLLLAAFVIPLEFYRRSANLNRATALVQAYLSEPPQVASNRLEALVSYSGFVETLLMRELSNGDNSDRLRSALGMARLGVKVDEHLSIALQILNDSFTEDEFAFIVEEFRRYSPKTNYLIESTFRAAKSPASRSQYAALALCLGNQQLAAELYANQRDQTEATMVGKIIDAWLRNQRTASAVNSIANQFLDSCQTASTETLFHLLVSVRELDFNGFDESTQKRWREFVDRQHQSNPDSGVHSCCKMLGKRWQVALSELKAEKQPPSNRDWWIVKLNDDIEVTYVRIRPGAYVRGLGAEHWEKQPLRKDYFPIEKVEIEEQYWIASTELPFSLVNHWCNSSRESQVLSELEKYVGDDLASRPDCAAYGIAYDEAFRMIEGVNKFVDLDGQYKLDFPTQDEWEFACRAGSETTFPWGDLTVEDQLPKFAVVSLPLQAKKAISPSGSLVPNRLGIFDMIGNVREYAKQTPREVLMNPEPLAFAKGGGTELDGNLFSAFWQSILTSNRFWKCGVRAVIRVR